MPSGIEKWGTAPDGSLVHRVTIGRDGLTANLITYGATLQSLYLSGTPFSLVLGYPEYSPYIENPFWAGATVGRYANRIAHGRIDLDGKLFQLDQNAPGQHHLHGGRSGTSHRNWRLEDHTNASVSFSDRLPDGHMGYPGNLDVRITFQIAGKQRLKVSIHAVSDQPTLCSFTCHNYFNLDGSETIRGHELQVDADEFLPVDLYGIPTQGPLPVDDTQMDFRKPRPLHRLGRYEELDNNFCLSTSHKKLQAAAILWSSTSGIQLSVSTTEPGLQVFTGSTLYKKGNFGFLPFSGVALEPQNWPNAPNQPNFPDPVLLPDRPYNHTSTFEFS